MKQDVLREDASQALVTPSLTDTPPALTDGVNSSKPMPQIAVSADGNGVQIAIPPASVVADLALIARLTELVNLVYTAAEEGLFSPSYNRTNVEEIRQSLQSGELALAWRAPSCSTAEPSPPSPESLIGCVRILRLSASHGDFGMLVCDPTFRGSGTGRELVKFAEERCRGLGITVMQCELLVSTEFIHPFKARMQAWYERLGYKVVRDGDFNTEYPHLSPHLITKTVYRIFEKNLGLA